MTDPITDDAPSLVSLLAEMRLYTEILAALRVWGAAPKAWSRAQESADRAERAVLDFVSTLTQRAETAERERERDELLRLLRVAMTVDSCEYRNDDVSCNEPAVFVTDSSHGPIADGWCAEHAPTWMKRSEHPQAADVRRISELLKETSDG